MNYGQASTDAKERARSGVWAIERGQIFIAPWIQSTETVVVKWDGIKRVWTDSDPIFDDPTFDRAVSAYVLRDHYKYFEKDEAQAQISDGDFREALQMMMHSCREETRRRDCEPSYATGAITANTTNLFYNDEQKASVSCPGGTVGQVSTFIVAPSTVSSTISKSDANQKAQQLALAQATGNLVCEEEPALYYNEAVSYTAECLVDPNAPPPEGTPQTITIDAGMISSPISVDAATAEALAIATATAKANLQCVFWNKAQTYVATIAKYASICSGTLAGADISVTISAHTEFSTFSQADADAKALNDAKVEAESQIAETWTCTYTPAPTPQDPNPSPVTDPVTTYYSTPFSRSYTCATTRVTQVFTTPVFSASGNNGQAIANQLANDWMAGALAQAQASCPPTRSGGIKPGGFGT
jgi:hypothetical protein